MAKIQKYSVIGSSKRSNGNYIKVSELMEWISKEKDRQNEMKLETDAVVGAYYLGGLETLNKLLAAIDTEGK